MVCYNNHKHHVVVPIWQWLYQDRGKTAKCAISEHESTLEKFRQDFTFRDTWNIQKQFNAFPIMRNSLLIKQERKYKVRWRRGKRLYLRSTKMPSYKYKWIIHFLINMNKKQLINDFTHDKGLISDLVIEATDKQLVSNIGVISTTLSDHHTISFNLPWTKILYFKQDWKRLSL